MSFKYPLLGRGWLTSNCNGNSPRGLFRTRGGHIDLSKEEKKKRRGGGRERERDRGFGLG
jgi:hypothetical protein